MIEHRDEIFARPKRTWFMTEKEKKLRESEVAIKEKIFKELTNLKNAHEVQKRTVQNLEKDLHKAREET